MTLSSIGLIIFQGVCITLVAPLTVGLIRRFKARYQNRIGAPIYQPYLALATLCRKEMTIPEHSSWVFRFVPYAVGAATLLLAFIVPTLGVFAWPSDISNIFVVISLAALASIFMVLGGMDTGSAFGNMGASREMTLVALVEPAFFITGMALAYLAGSGSLDGILAHFVASPWVKVETIAFPSLLALLLIILAENARYPVDNPATHLELTMVHEALLLEYSGPYLAMLEYTAMLRLSVMGAFFMSLVLPFWIATPSAGFLLLAGSALFLIIKLVIFAFVIASIESLIVKMRFYRMQEYFALAFLLAFIGTGFVFLGSLI